MKSKLIIAGLAVLFVGVLMYPNPALAGIQGTVTDDHSAGTHTIKATINVATTTGFGHSHTSTEAVKTPWIAVPVMKDFMIHIEQASDSSVSLAAFAGVGVDGDTVHIALETATALSLVVVDSVKSLYQHHLAKIVWWRSDLNWSGFNWSTYFPMGALDTNALDTLAVAATSNKAHASGGPARAYNLGMLRFSLCGDDADSATDGAIALNCYIIYHEATPAKSYGTTPDEGLHFAWVDQPEHPMANDPRFSDDSRRTLRARETPVLRSAPRKSSMKLIWGGR